MFSQVQILWGVEARMNTHIRIEKDLETKVGRCRVRLLVEIFQENNQSFTWNLSEMTIWKLLQCSKWTPAMTFLSRRYLIKSYWSSLLGGDWRTCLRKQRNKRSWLCMLYVRGGGSENSLFSYSKPFYPCLWFVEVGKKAMESWQLSAPSREWHVISTHNPLAKISHLSPSNCKERISSH